MKIQVALVKGFLRWAVVAAAIVIGAGWAHGQALLVEELPGGTHLVVVTQPLADATSVVWPPPPGGDDTAPRVLVGGRLTLTADLESALGALDEESPPPAPPVVVAVGGATADEISGLLERVFAGRATFPSVVADEPALTEGGLDRRLGPPGSDARLRLEVAMPSPGDRRRSSAEVLWELVPELLSERVPHLRSRVQGEVGILEGGVEADLAEMAVSDLRLGLARLASDPNLDVDDVARARRRLQVRRLSALEEHPGAARQVYDAWVAGGEEAVRELVFGVHGVTVESVRATAASWLPTHPGRAQLILPPRVFNPRFAVGPEVVRLDNDLTAGVLERSGAPLAVVCLRPVMVPDLDGEVTATVLARLARALREADDRPGSVRVRTAPPLIELAGPADGFGELMEQLTRAVAAVTADTSPVASGGGDARRAALDLMADNLGITESGEPSAASLLRPGNLALGVVAPDAEAAVEAIGKFWDQSPPAGADVQSVATALRTRAAAPGELSTVVAALEMAFGGNEAGLLVTRELLVTRAREIWPDAQVEVLASYVPGRSMLLLLVTADGTVDEVEERVATGWRRLVAEVSEVELAPVRRRVAAAASAEMSGVAGHARRSAAVAAGASRWRQPAELELEILTVPEELVSALLEGFADADNLVTTGAGVLPIDELERR
ncbi:MAG: hypothetical protein V2I67_04520 [Thermoanaerobaculales bacterium]|nr:hypothetical protein [Thermoanaerobaculales bacterium]